jgi:hypothetical protein
MVPETPADSKQATWLIAQKDFINFSGCENLRICTDLTLNLLGAECLNDFILKNNSQKDGEIEINTTESVSVYHNEYLVSGFGAHSGLWLAPFKEEPSATNTLKTRSSESPKGTKKVYTFFTVG